MLFTVSVQIGGGTGGTGGGDDGYNCPTCGRWHRTQRALQHHIQSVHDNDDDIPIDTQFSNDFACLRLARSSLNRLCCDFEIVPHDIYAAQMDFECFLNCASILVSDLFEYGLRDYIVKAKLTALLEFDHFDPDTNQLDRRQYFFFHSQKAQYVYIIDDWYDDQCRTLRSQIDKFVQCGSNWRFKRVVRVDIKASLIENQSGACHEFILPPALRKTRSVINVKLAPRDCCFKYAVLSVLHYRDIQQRHKRPKRGTYHRWCNDLVLPDDRLSIQLSDIPKIEKANNLKINIHVWNRKLIGIRYNNAKVIAPKTVNLLLVVDPNDPTRRHYCGITQLSRLYHHKFQEMRRLEKPQQSIKFCERCCRPFYSLAALQKHYNFCAQGKLILEDAPKDPKFQYKKSFLKLESPRLIFYADIECYIDPSTQVHKPGMVGLYCVLNKEVDNHDGHLQAQIPMRTWMGGQCIDQFLNYLGKTAEFEYQHEKELTRKPMNELSLEELHLFHNASKCQRCNEPFSRTNYRVRDHSHLNGKFRQTLCSKCNINIRQQRRTFYVIFHNFKGYDSHIICKYALGKQPDWLINVIPRTTEHFLTLTIKIPVDKLINQAGKEYTVYFQVKFIDSFQFMASSLANLVRNLSDVPFARRLQRLNPNVSDAVIRQKGVFPYTYFTSMECLNETHLPEKHYFYNDLTNQHITDAEYEHAQRAWTEFGCRTLRDYTKAYLHLDIYLLADVFEEFRRVSKEEDELDPVHFISLPSLTYQSAFKFTGVEIELLQDIDMYRLFERGIRGGISFVNQHHAERHVHDAASTMFNTHLAYIDENNLYGNSLCQPLPQSEFQWITAVTNFDKDFILSIADDAEYGYVLEVDLYYPPEIHAATVDLPLAPEHYEVTEDMWSPFMQEYYKQISEQWEGTSSKKKYKPCRKLLLTHYSKYHYVVHYRILKFYFRMGLQLLKVHSIIKFRQSAFFKPYVVYNSKKRASCKNAFQKDYYKLKNNALFGKTMEDVRKRIVYELVNDSQKAQQRIADPLFMDRDIISDDLVGIHTFKPRTILNKPIYIGQAVLDNSKLEMYELYYYTLKPCPLVHDMRILGGDTDSFFLQLRTSTEIMLDDIFDYFKDYLDSSNYQQNHRLFTEQNKAKLGCFKDETAGRLISEIIHLRPKMYSMLFADQDPTTTGQIKRAKGIVKALVKTFNHQLYQDAFHHKIESYVEMVFLQSKQHTMQTKKTRKRGLSAWDDKRCWLAENESLPYGSSLSTHTWSIPVKRMCIELPISGDIRGKCMCI